MNAEWFISEIYKIQRNKTCLLLKKDLEFDTKYDYKSLLLEAESTLKTLNNPGGGYKPPLREETRMVYIKQIEAIIAYLKTMLG